MHVLLHCHFTEKNTSLRSTPNLEITLIITGYNSLRMYIHLHLQRFGGDILKWDEKGSQQSDANTCDSSVEHPAGNAFVTVPREVKQTPSISRISITVSHIKPTKAGHLPPNCKTTKKGNCSNNVNTKAKVIMMCCHINTIASKQNQASYHRFNPYLRYKLVM